tara:strand:- start:5361 stop:5579 length:219 start_codon:yes stop_codon:yes gene_type:complete
MIFSTILSSLSSAGRPSGIEIKTVLTEHTLRLTAMVSHRTRLKGIRVPAVTLMGGSPVGAALKPKHRTLLRS